MVKSILIGVAAAASLSWCLSANAGGALQPVLTKEMTGPVLVSVRHTTNTSIDDIRSGLAAAGAIQGHTVISTRGAAVGLDINLSAVTKIGADCLSSVGGATHTRNLHEERIDDLVKKLTAGCKDSSEWARDAMTNFTAIKQRGESVFDAVRKAQERFGMKVPKP